MTSLIPPAHRISAKPDYEITGIRDDDVMRSATIYVRATLRTLAVRRTTNQTLVSMECVCTNPNTADL